MLSDMSLTDGMNAESHTDKSAQTFSFIFSIAENSTRKPTSKERSNVEIDPNVSQHFRKAELSCLHRNHLFSICALNPVIAK